VVVVKLAKATPVIFPGVGIGFRTLCARKSMEINTMGTKFFMK
jgi:hypothetical protein